MTIYEYSLDNQTNPSEAHRVHQNNLEAKANPVHCPIQSEPLEGVEIVPNPYAGGFFIAKYDSVQQTWLYRYYIHNAGGWIDQIFFTNS